MENEDPFSELIIADGELNRKAIAEFIRALQVGKPEPAAGIMFVGLDESVFPPDGIDGLLDFVRKKEYRLQRLILEYQGGLIYTCIIPEGKVKTETSVSFYLGETAGKKAEKLTEQLRQVNINRFIVLSRIVREPSSYVVIGRSMLDTLGKAGGGLKKKD